MRALICGILFGLVGIALFYTVFFVAGHLLLRWWTIPTVMVGLVAMVLCFALSAAAFSRWSGS